MNPAHPLVQAYNAHILNQFLDAELDKLFISAPEAGMHSKDAPRSDKSIIGLAAES